MADVPTVTLSDGTTLPAIGFGTYPLKGEDGVEAIVSALEAGYRLLDTAVNYGNEDGGRRGDPPLRGAPRRGRWSTSKIPGRHHAYDDAIASRPGSRCEPARASTTSTCTSSTGPTRARTGTPRRGGRWSRLQQRGAGAHPSASPTSPRRTCDRIIDETGVTPAVNQIELHPYFPQAQMRAVQRASCGIRTESWSPMGKRQAPFDRAAGGRRGRGARRHARPGDPALAASSSARSRSRSRPRPQRQRAEPRRLRLRAHRRRDGRDHRRSAAPDGRLFGGDPDTHEEM